MGLGLNIRVPYPRERCNEYLQLVLFSCKEGFGIIYRIITPQRPALMIRRAGA
jgi:hypothetical protein